MRFVKIDKNGKVKREQEERWVIEGDKKKSSSKTKEAPKAKAPAKKK